MTEQRKTSRKIFRTATTVSMASGQSYLARSYDLGQGGMAVITPVQMETSGQCTVGFEIPTADDKLKISAQARIVYSIPCAEGFKNGLQFIDLGAAGLAALRDYLADRP